MIVWLVKGWGIEYSEVYGVYASERGAVQAVRRRLFSNDSVVLEGAVQRHVRGRVEGAGTVRARKFNHRSDQARPRLASYRQRGAASWGCYSGAKRVGWRLSFAPGLALGKVINLNLLNGKEVAFRLPSRTKSGTKFRFRKGGEKGRDLHLIVRATNPKANGEP